MLNKGLIVCDKKVQMYVLIHVPSQELCQLPTYCVLVFSSTRTRKIYFFFSISILTLRKWVGGGGGCVFFEGVTNRIEDSQ